MRAYVGIDNGLDGGIACLRADGNIQAIHALPTVKVGKGRKLDIVTLSQWVVELRKQCDNAVTVAVERPTKHSPGKMALCSTWFTYGQIEGWLELSGIRFHEITSPLTWQKMFWARPKMAEGQKFDTKAAALRVATQLWPGTYFTATEKSVKPHDGIVDALLIAEYARRSNL